MTTINTNTKNKTITIKILKEKLFGFAIWYSKKNKSFCLVLPFLVLEFTVKKALIELN